MLRHPARSLITSRSPAPTASHPTLSLASVGIDGAVVPRRRFVNLILRRRVHRRVLMRRRRWHRRSVRIVKIFLPHPRRLQSTRSRLCRQRRRRHQERLRATRRLRHRRRPHRRHSGHRARRRGLHPLFNLSPRLRPILHRRSRQHPRRFRRRALHADDARQPLPDGDHLPLHQHILPHRQRRSIHHLPPHLQQHHRHPRRLHDDALDHLPSSAALELFARVTRPSPLPPPALAFVAFVARIACIALIALVVASFVIAFVDATALAPRANACATAPRAASAHSPARARTASHVRFASYARRTSSVVVVPSASNITPARRPRVVAQSLHRIQSTRASHPRVRARARRRDIGVIA